MIYKIDIKFIDVSRIFITLVIDKEMLIIKKC